MANLSLSLSLSLKEVRVVSSTPVRGNKGKFSESGDHLPHYRVEFRVFSAEGICEDLIIPDHADLDNFPPQMLLMRDGYRLKNGMIMARPSCEKNGD